MDSNDPQKKTLEDRIQSAQEKSAPPKEPEIDANRQIGMRAGGEFMAHVLAGILLGWALDSFFDSAPLLMVLFLLVGFGTGIYRCSRLLAGK